MNQLLIVYAKCPLPRSAKTRLGATIGMEQAAGVYARLLYSYLLDVVRFSPPDMSVVLSVATLDDVHYFVRAFPEFEVRAQVEGSLGERMEASFARAFAAGAEAVVLTGSDIPGLRFPVVRDAFHALETDPVVIGPARDGGYYLIGMRAPGAPLFEGIAWSSAHVLAQTVALAEALGLAVKCVSEQVDIDTLEELEIWQQGMLCSRCSTEGAD